MPATYITYANGGRILPVERGQAGLPPSGTIELTAAYLSSFGSMRVPANLWLAFRRHAAWIEPAVIAEWTRKIRDYARGQDRQIAEGSIAAALRWSDPERDVARVRAIAVKLLDAGRVKCVWTGRVLNDKYLDIDHMFPWSAWPCGDLWNLRPAHRDVKPAPQTGSAAIGCGVVPSRGKCAGLVERGLCWPAWFGSLRAIRPGGSREPATIPDLGHQRHLLCGVAAACAAPSRSADPRMGWRGMTLQPLTARPHSLTGAEERLTGAKRRDRAAPSS
jgi:hypothetical protein